MSLAMDRLASLFDEGGFNELDRFAKNGDGACEVVTGFGSVAGNPCYAFAQDSSVCGGAMGGAQAAKIARVYDLAEKTGYPVVGIFDSNGAHVDEGIGAVSAYSELIAKANRLSGVVPQIAVIAGPCGVSSAIWATCSDVVVMSDNAELFLTAPSLTGSDKAGTAEAAVANGTAHIAAGSVDEAVGYAKKLVSLLPSNNLSAAAVADCVPAASDITAAKTADEYIAAIADADSVVELRRGFGTESETAIVRIGGMSTGIVAAFGSLDDADCRKIVSFVGLCDAFSIPLITLVDTDGFVKAAENELDGLVKSASALTKAYTESTTAKIAVITGKAYGPAYITFAGKSSGADAVLALKEAVISSIAPEAAALIVYNERLHAGEDIKTLTAEYISAEAAPMKAAALGLIDDVIEPSEIPSKIRIMLDMLMSKRVSTLDKKHTVSSL